MHQLGGVDCYKDKRLPCSKSEAICLPKGANIERQFWVDINDQVWGYFDTMGLANYVYLSEKAFDKMKNGKLHEYISE
jgi:hypothetical protein